MGRDIRSAPFRKSQRLTIDEFNRFGPASMAIRMNKIFATLTPLTRGIMSICIVAIIAIGGRNAADGRIGIGDIQAFIQYVTQVSEPVTEVSYTINSLQGAVASTERVFDILDEEEEPADHFIRTLPQGYETVIDGETANLSQGQRQLLTIARAILANPTIMILDEATSSVDTRTELEIQKAMDTLMKDRTSFIIAHRLSTIRNANRILVMNHGTIIEQGDHEELLARHGFYADLYNSQFEMPAR